MKKVLIASTALVAAGLMTTGTASASEKIKLQLGGFSKWWVAGKWNNKDYEEATGPRTSYNNVDVIGDNEIHFVGSTTLDNGMKVGIQVELEAGGHNDQSYDPIDASFVFVEGGFGKVLLGNHNNGTALLHVTAPDAAGNWNGDGLFQTSTIIAAPSNVYSVPYLNPGNTPAVAKNGLTTAIITDNKAEKITYVAPSFYGLTVGASYVPNLVEDNRGPQADDTEAMGAGALYANTFGGVGLKLSAGVVTYSVNPADASAASRSYEYAYGGQVSYAGFTLGGSYKIVNTNFRGQNASSGQTGSTVSEDGDAWDVGLQYANGPYAVSAAYFRSEVEGTRSVAGNDKIEIYQVSGKYNLGPGVDLLGSVGYMKFTDETTAYANNNKGWGVMTGMSLAF